jgi:hypothetical protein
VDYTVLAAQIRITNPPNKWNKNDWNNNWIDLPDDNKIINLIPGTHDYTIKFKIPSTATKDSYDIRWIIKDNRDGNWIGSRALDDVFRVKPSKSITPTITVVTPDNGETYQVDIYRKSDRLSKD